MPSECPRCGKHPALVSDERWLWYRCPCGLQGLAASDKSGAEKLWMDARQSWLRMEEQE